MLLPGLPRGIYALGILLTTALLFFSLFFTDLSVRVRERLPGLTTHSTEPDLPPPPPPPAPPPPPPAAPELLPPRETHKPIVDHFPLLHNAEYASSLPPVPSYNAPPSKHFPERTPLFIGFTRNWGLIQQTVVSYITAGWPPEDIYVVDNTGTMDSNRKGKLTLQNPFYLNHHRLTNVFGINVLNTPALLTFAQLQTFFMSYALEHDWETYFWGHMDVAALSQEGWVDPGTGEYKSLYVRAVDQMRATFAPGYEKWAIHFFAYDRLALVNLAAYMDIGGWDPLISYYLSDCDFHERLYMAKYGTPVADAGNVYDIGDSVDDLLVFYRREEIPSGHAPSEKWGPPSTLNSPSFRALEEELLKIEDSKGKHEGGRNSWQTRQEGGEGEPFYRDPDGFAIGLEMAIQNGIATYHEKWAYRKCDLRDSGRDVSNAWRYKKDF